MYQQEEASVWYAQSGHFAAGTLRSQAEKQYDNLPSISTFT